jgi:hypothetical protein
MGTIQHKFLVVIGDPDAVEKLHDLTSRFNERQKQAEEAPVSVTPIYLCGNGFTSFAILPSGSKVGWPYHQASVELIEAVENAAALDREGPGEALPRPYATTFRGEWGELDPRWQIDGRGQL